MMATAGRSAATAVPTAAIPTPVSTPVPLSPASALAPAAGQGADFSTAIRWVAQEVKPAVVQITNEQVQVDQFNQPFTVPAGVGSGVIYDAQGHILTNAHVVAGAEQLLVALPDGRSFPGKLVGQDPQTDLAVVQISGDHLPVAQLGDSRQLQVGDWVVAIGNALALPGGPTVTAGLVSALGRTVQEPGSWRQQGPYLFDVIQTSAPINPGNSGGPLANLAGQVVGINTLIADQAEPGVQAEGIGFAIAISTAKPIADQLVATGQVTHAFLGMDYVTLTPSLALRLRTAQKQGVVVARVTRGSPAFNAGLQPGDIITQADGTPLLDDSVLAGLVNAHQPGDTLTMQVLRDDQAFSVQVVLGEMSSS